MTSNAARIFLALLAIVLAPNHTTAQEKTLQDLVGVWSNADAGCTPAVSGPLDDLDKATANKHALVGICAEGFNLVHQPVRCKASRIVRRTGALEISTACSVKDYPVDRFRLTIRMTDPDAIVFDEKDFNGRNFSISGPYLRCSKVYSLAIDSETAT